ncbi:M23 family metallopeptidase [Microbacterium sp. CJ88]|uniref:M23 family metallopeptidase n=1 Tax=Microbacterium sp. CJ88 TaxID=3445672 RepID=UPI003F65846D
MPAPSSSGTAAPTASPTPTAGAGEQFTPILASVLAPPVPVASTDGATHLAYELVVTNALSQDVTLDVLEVRSGSDAVLTLAGDDLTARMVVRSGTGPTRTLGPGQQGTVVLDVAILAGARVPGRLSHAITLTATRAVEPVFSSPMTETVGDVGVSTEDPVVISSPLRGERWFDGNGCCGMTPHRLALNPINGRIFAPERFAIDAVQLTADGRIATGPVDDLASYPYEGADIHAVADGPVVAMTSDRPEQKPGANPTGLTLDEYGGNYVVQSIGGGRYAFYAHLQPGNPLGLTVGRQLTRGDVLGRLGNSGNSDSPHLHFHVMDSPLPLASNGLPFVFDQVQLLGTVPTDASFDACIASLAACTIDPKNAGPLRATGLLTGDVFTAK